MTKNTEPKAKFDAEIAYNLIIRRLDSFENYVDGHFNLQDKQERNQNFVYKAVAFILTLLTVTSLFVGIELSDRVAKLEQAQQIEFVNENR